MNKTTFTVSFQFTTTTTSPLLSSALMVNTELPSNLKWSRPQLRELSIRPSHDEIREKVTFKMRERPWKVL